MKCSICGKKYEGYGNNPAPFKRSPCCDQCNRDVILPLRLFLAGTNLNQLLIIKPEGDIIFSEPMEKVSLKRLQEEVNGYIEFYPKPNSLFKFIVDEEGLLKNKTINMLGVELFGIKAVGNIIVCPKKLLS